MMVDHDAGSASRFENAQNFSKALRRVGAVMKNPVGIDDIEGVAGKSKIFGVRELKVARQIGGLAALARTLERCRGKIHSGGEGPRLQPFEIISSHADSDLKHPQSSRG